MLGRQWETRLALWNENLQKRFVKPYEKLQTAYFTTFDRLSYREACLHEFTKTPEGFRWGRKWEYGWFKTSFSVPAGLSGKRLVVFLAVSNEMLVFVNGEERGSIDKQHKFITLTRCAEAGKHYDIVAEAYAGHGARVEDAGPVGADEVTVPDDPGLQVMVEGSFVGVFEEDIFQASMDYMCLYELAKSLPETSLRRMKVLEGLKQFTYIADFELPYVEMVESIVKAREILKPLLLCKNGSTAPEFTVFGQSHIDLAWLWPEEETKRKAARTYSNQLVLMEEYPEFRFLMCSPTILEYAKELYPALYERIKKGVSEGRFYPEGGMWVECDTHIPSGESIIRQFVKGRRWFKEEMNSDSVLAWMPDTFGFSGNLPQIMKKCGIKYFTTQKLLRQDPECEPFPYNTFMWEGIDGTQILSHIYKKNNSQFTPSHLTERWEKDRNQQENIDSMLFPFGFGDGGGGCTRTMLEQVRRCGDLEGAPRCRVESPVSFFERAEQKNISETYVGELYLAWHRGTLTSQAKTKRGIRKAEVALHNLEFLMSKVLCENSFHLSGTASEKYEECKASLEKLWDDLLFCQFHDIAPGTGIERVNKEAVEKLNGVTAEAERLLAALSKACYGNKEMIYNMTGLEKNCHGVNIPAYSSADVFECAKKAPDIRETENGISVTNAHFTCIIDKEGHVVSFKRKDSEKEYVCGAWNRFLMFNDVNTCYDAWEIGSMYENVPVELDGETSVTSKIVGDECLVHVEKKLHGSLVTQDIVIGEDSERIDFRTNLDWQERHKLLKVSFNSEVFANEAYHDIQFGYVKRPTHKSKRSDRDRYEVSNRKFTAVADGAYGVAVLNDCKYGVNVKYGDIRLTLMKAPLAPDMHADVGEHEFTYSVYAFEGHIDDSLLENEAYDLNNPVVMLPGNAGGSLFATDKNNVIIESVFPSEDGKAVILRVYEAMGKETEAKVLFGILLTEALETDMMLRNGRKLPVNAESVSLRFTPFEIKTIIVK